MGLMKFHLLLAVPAAMLAAKRWKMLKGFCAVGASAVLISVLLGGFAGARGFVDLLLADNLSRLWPSPELMINLHSLRWNLGLGGGGGLLLSSLLVVLAIGLAAVAIHRAPPWRFLAATLLLSPLAVPNFCKVVKMTPPLATFSSSRRSSRSFACSGFGMRSLAAEN